jgi:hypothetical protein
VPTCLGVIEELREEVELLRAQRELVAARPRPPRRAINCDRPGAQRLVALEGCRARQMRATRAIDPRTGRRGSVVPVADPHNLYFAADGRRVIVAAEATASSTSTPHTMRLTKRLRLPQCGRRSHGLHRRLDGRMARAP